VYDPALAQGGESMTSSSSFGRGFVVRHEYSHLR
jgi:hypothetical protein